MLALVFTFALAGCNGGGLPITSIQFDGGAADDAQASPAAPGDAGALAPVDCRVQLAEPFTADVDATCETTPDGLGLSARWVAGDLAWHVSASIDGPTVSWEWRPCEVAHVAALADGLGFQATCGGLPVRGVVTLQ